MMINRDQINVLLDAFDIVDDQDKLQYAEMIIRVFTKYLYAKTKYFTLDEITHMKNGEKLKAVKAVKERLGFSLLEAKKYVENYGGSYLASSGKYDVNGYKL